MNGVLVIDKPKGPTSHDVVAMVRRGLKIKKVGHTGTLDPMATGVLPLVLGCGTKLARYLTGGDKSYVATVKLGETTTTLDAEGEVTQHKEVVGIDEARIVAGLKALTGDIEQLPPMYSAKKVDGKKLYQLARKGVLVEREAKHVRVIKLELIDFSLPTLSFEVTCSAGTYVRVLAHDLGEALGVGGHLVALRRTGAGPFNLEHVTSLDTVREAPDKARGRILPLGHALLGLKRLDVDADLAKMIARGYQLRVADLRTLDTPNFNHDEALAVGTQKGDIIAVMRAQIAFDDLAQSRRDRQAFKTERVLTQLN